MVKKMLYILRLGFFVIEVVLDVVGEYCWVFMFVS